MDVLALCDCIVFEVYVPESALEQDLADAVGVILPSLAGEVLWISRGGADDPITADTGGLGEVGGDARLKFNVGNAKGLAERVRETLEKRGRMTELQRKARQRARSDTHAVKACRRVRASDGSAEF